MRGTIESVVVSNNLKSARVRNGLLQEDVAKLLGVSRQTIISYENNPENLKLWQFNKLAEIYGCSVNYFFGF